MYMLTELLIMVVVAVDIVVAMPEHLEMANAIDTLVTIVWFSFGTAMIYATNRLEHTSDHDDDTTGFETHVGDPNDKMYRSIIFKLFDTADGSYSNEHYAIRAAAYIGLPVNGWSIVGITKGQSETSLLWSQLTLLHLKTPITEWNYAHSKLVYIRTDKKKKGGKDVILAFFFHAETRTIFYVDSIIKCQAIAAVALGYVVGNEVLPQPQLPPVGDRTISRLDFLVSHITGFQACADTNVSAMVSCISFDADPEPVDPEPEREPQYEPERVYPEPEREPQCEPKRVYPEPEREPQCEPENIVAGGVSPVPFGMPISDPEDMTPLPFAVAQQAPPRDLVPRVDIDVAFGWMLQDQDDPFLGLPCLDP
jgi:hypothetical protein